MQKATAMKHATITAANVGTPQTSFFFDEKFGGCGGEIMGGGGAGSRTRAVAST